jgi:GNAT superfamily N-acetyltransferase
MTVPAGAVQGLPANFDYGSLERALNTTEGQNLPESVKARMRDAIARSRSQPQPMQAAMPDDTNVAGIAPVGPPTPDTSWEAQHPMGVERFKQNLRETVEAVNLPVPALLQVAHDVTMGLVPEPVVDSAAGYSQYNIDFWNNTFKPLVKFTAIVGEARAITSALSFVGKIPAVSRVLESIPLRMQHIGAGAIVGAGIDALRPEMPKDPDLIDITGVAGKKLSEATGMSQRTGTAIAGGVFGGVAGEIFMGVAAGIQKGRSMYLAGKLSADQLQTMREALQSSGVAIEDNANRYKLAQTFVKNLRKIAMPSESSGIVADRLAREQYIMTELIGSANSASTRVAQEGAEATSTQDLSKLVSVGNPGISMESAAGSKIVKIAYRDANGKPMGLLTLSQTAPDKADVFTVFVDPSVRRQGIATKLYDYADAMFPGGVRSGQSGLSGEGKAFVAARTGQAPALPMQAEADAATEAESQRILKSFGKGTPGHTVQKKNGFDMLVARDQSGNPTGALQLDAATGGPRKVIDVFVSPSARRQGVATGLYDYAEKNLGGIVSGQSGLTPQGQAFTQARAAQVRPPRATEDDARLIAGVFRTNPGGISIVRGVSSVDALDLARTKLGIKLDQRVLIKGVEQDADGVYHGVYDVVLSRPSYRYPEASTLGRLNDKVTRSLKALAQTTAKDIKAPRTTEAYILSDGTPVRGGLSTADLESKLHLQKPIVAGQQRPDLALKVAAQHVKMDLVADRELVIDLPARLSQEQFNALGRSVDAIKMNRVTLRAIDGTERLLETPIGAQVQDAVAELVKPQSVGSVLSDNMVNQYRKTGVFKGQAVVLPDGTAGEIVSKRGALKGQGARYQIRDSLTGVEHVVSEGQLTLLPTTLTSELQPSSLFTQYLTEPERIGLAKLRFAVSQGWAEEITKVRDLKDFGNTRGYTVNSLRGGKFELAKVNDGGAEPLMFANMKSAVEFLRKDNSALPNLTSERVANLLGENLNIGWIGGGGHTPNVGELMPINWKHLESAVERLLPDRGVGLVELVTKPSKALFDAIDKRYDIQFGKVFENVQSSLVGKQNFEYLWWQGKGGRLPDGVLPLKKIGQLAEKDANWELITDWRETPKGTPEADVLFKTMRPGEQKAAIALGKWYDAAYTHFGVDAPFVENYMPHMREMAEKGNGTDISTLWKLIGGDPLHPPKGMDWVADHVRDGLMDIYEKDARKVALSYLRGAGHSRFMREPTEQAAELMKLVYTKNKQLGLIMANYMDAIRGTEFPEQRAALGETFRRVLENLPVDGKSVATAAAADKLVDVLTGAVYSSTMGFRPALALRNASSALVMAWPLYGGNGRFVEAITRAMTREGLQEAIQARAISVGQGARFSQPEVEAALRDLLPEKLMRMNEVGMTLYESADQFTRSVTYHAAKMRAEDAIVRFVKDVEGASPKAVEAAKRRLITDSRMFLHSPDVVDDFLRRAGQNPNLAAQFAGKQASDVTNFLYGRGMQARWMRSVGGRLFGQFGTWPMWYLDYLNRMATRIGQNGYAGEAMRLLARHALVNAAIVGAGKEVLDVDLSRWASYGSLFYSGGPGLTALAGASTLMRGLGEVTSGNEDPLSQSRVTEGMQTIWNTMPTYVPFYFGARDVIKLAEADDNVQKLAAVLGTRPTRDYTTEQRMDMLLGRNRKPFSSSSAEVEDVLNARAMQKPTVDVRGLGAQLGLKGEYFGIPEAMVQGTGQPASSRTSMQQSAPAGQFPTTTPASIKQGTPGESQPIKRY